MREVTVEFTQEEFNQLINNLNPLARGVRRGQNLMNVLYEIKPEMYEVINNSKFDCFYDDNIIDSTLQYLLSVVENQK